MTDLIVIGSGPAGISAALYAVRSNLSVCVISKNEGSLQRAEKIENYYGFGEPVSGTELFEAGVKNAKRLGVDFINDEIVSISLEKNFNVVGSRDTFETKSVILSTGALRKTPEIKNLPDFEGKGVSYCAQCDAFFYRNKKVAVLGNGSFAQHEANFLKNIVREVTILTNGNKLNFETDISVFEHRVISLEGDLKLQKILFEDGSCIDCDGLFIALGIAGSTALARKIGAVIEGNRIVINSRCETSVPGLYAAGDCTGGLLQISKAVYEGALAGIEAAKFIKNFNK